MGVVQDLTIFISSYVLVWDIRPSLESQRSKINLNGMLGNGTDVLYTYLNLVWTPFIRVSMQSVLVSCAEYPLHHYTYTMVALVVVYVVL